MFSIDSACIGLGIVYTRFSSLSVGILAVCIHVFNVLMQCIEGTIVSIQNEKLLMGILNLPWYELSKSQQKIFLQFIHECQGTHVLTVPIVGTLNMQLFTNVVNGAYSFLMFIIQFVKVTN